MQKLPARYIYTNLNLFLNSNFMANYYDITLALAGLCQSTKLVFQFANHGKVDEHPFSVSLNTLMITSPESTLEVYGNDVKNLALGLTTLLEQLGGAKGKNDLEISRYWMSLLVLESKLQKNPAAKNELAKRIQHLPTQLQHYNLLEERMLSNLASIYVDIISPLGNKILVKGSTQLLQQTTIHQSIRACLLAGMRSAILWKQVGGSKWQLLFSRNKMINTANNLLDSF